MQAEIINACSHGRSNWVIGVLFAPAWQPRFAGPRRPGSKALDRPGQRRAVPEVPEAGSRPAAEPVRTTRSVVAVALVAVLLGLPALLPRRLALVAVAAAVVVVLLVAGRAEALQQAVAHRRFLSGEGINPSSGDEGKVTMWSQLKNHLCDSCQPAQRNTHVCEPAQAIVKSSGRIQSKSQGFLFSVSAQGGE